MIGVEGGSTAGFLAGFSLETLVAPYDLTEFTTDHWDRIPLLVQRGLPDFYTGLTSISEIDAAVAAGAIQVSSADAGSRHEQVQARDHTEPSSLAIDTVLARMAEGKTLILKHAETALPGHARMCRLLMVETGHPWHCDIHATPPGGQGLDARVDAMGVFILQLDGSKDWTFGNSQFCRPVTSEHVRSIPVQWEKDSKTARLNAGDMLYLPRGVPHAAMSANGCGSLHIALSVAEYSWSQLANTEVDAKARPRRAAKVPPLDANSPLRDLLPLGFHRDDATLIEQCETRLPDSEPARVHAFLEQQVHAFEPDLAGRFTSALGALSLSPTAKLLRRKDTLWRIVQSGSMCQVISGPIRLAFPAHARPFVETLLTQGGELDQIDDDLTEPERIAIANSLLRHNLLRRG